MPAMQGRLISIEGPDGAAHATPEYEDVKRIAAAKNVPLKVIYEEALRSCKK